jgi:hypothetical protein
MRRMLGLAAAIVAAAGLVSGAQMRVVPVDE